MPVSLSRREFLSRASGATAGVVLAGCLPQTAVAQPVQAPFKISLAQWSLHRTLRSGQLDHLDFARTARRDFGLEAIEYVNTFFKTRASDAGYLAEMNRRAADHGVYQHLIMIDAEGALGGCVGGRVSTRRLRCPDVIGGASPPGSSANRRNWCWGWLP